MELESINKWNYGHYSSGNYGAHSLCFSADGRDYYYSYDTLVAVRANGRLMVRENYWGPTTGKHLNWIDGGSKEAKAKRLNEADFEQAIKSL